LLQNEQTWCIKSLATWSWVYPNVSYYKAPRSVHTITHHITPNQPTNQQSLFQILSFVLNLLLVPIPKSIGTPPAASGTSRTWIGLRASTIKTIREIHDSKHNYLSNKTTKNNIDWTRRDIAQDKARLSNSLILWDFISIVVVSKQTSTVEVVIVLLTRTQFDNIWGDVRCISNSDLIFVWMAFLFSTQR